MGKNKGEQKASYNDSQFKNWWNSIKGSWAKKQKFAENQGEDRGAGSVNQSSKVRKMRLYACIFILLLCIAALLFINYNKKSMNQQQIAVREQVMDTTATKVPEKPKTRQKVEVKEKIQTPTESTPTKSQDYSRIETEGEASSAEPVIEDPEPELPEFPNPATPESMREYSQKMEVHRAWERRQVTKE